jgi:hypothetical protein
LNFQEIFVIENSIKLQTKKKLVLKMSIFFFKNKNKNYSPKMLKLLESGSIFYDVKILDHIVLIFHLFFSFTMLEVLGCLIFQLFFSFTMLEVLGCKCDLLHAVGVAKVLKEVL